MKNGKKPNKAQSIFIAENGYNPKDYLVERDTPELMAIVSKSTQELIKIYK